MTLHHEVQGSREYIAEYEQEAATPLGQQIIASRWRTVKNYCKRGTLLDFGCGAGAFHMAAPPSFVATGWDVNPYSVFNKPYPCGPYDVLTLWDVIEHLSAPMAIVGNYGPQFIFISTPNAANTNLSQFRSWKHYKPDEHIHYYTPLTLAISLAAAGYSLQGYDHVEGRLRDPLNPKAIFTAVFTKDA